MYSLGYLSLGRSAATAMFGSLRLILIVPLNEMHRAVFVAALGRTVQNHQRTDPFFNATGIAGIGVIDRTVFILIEGAHAGQLIEGILRRKLVKIIEHPIVFEFILREGDVIIEIEITAFRRNPWEVPTHSLLVGFKLCPRSARNGNKRDIVIV